MLKRGDAGISDLVNLFCARARSVASTATAWGVTPPRWIARLFLVAGLAGCGGLEPVATYDDTITESARLYTSLTLSHPALNLSTAATYNTWQLTATPRNALGEPIAGLPTPSYRSSDTTAVHVTAAGLLTAWKAATNVQVIAELIAPGNIRHADTTMVNVTSFAPPAIASLSLDPVPPDSAIVPIGFPVRNALLGSASGAAGTRQLTPRVLDTTGAAVTGLQIEYVSLNPTIATVDRRNGLMQMKAPGKAYLVAQTTAYGVTSADTVQFTVTLASGANVEIRSHSDGVLSFGPTEVVIRSYGVVYWILPRRTAVDVIFDDPTNIVSPPVCSQVPMVFIIPLGLLGPGPHCSPGNIDAPLTDPNAPTSSVTVRTRQFPVPGVYRYRSSLTGATGKVVVMDGLAP